MSARLQFVVLTVPELLELAFDFQSEQFQNSVHKGRTIRMAMSLLSKSLVPLNTDDYGPFM